MSWPNNEQRAKIYDNITADAKPSFYFFAMVVLSCTVATYGLLSNSTAVIIGAMLIAPLIGPILGGAIALTSNNNDLLKTSIKAEVLGAVTAVLLAVILTLILPGSHITAEVLSRTKPTIVDLVIALASGVAGTYAMCVKPQSATLPGVAIATALMPPLCVVGIGLAKQDFNIVTGAFLLFLANMIAINVAAIATFELAGFSQKNNFNAIKYRIVTTNNKIFFYPIILLLVISIPLAVIMYKTYNTANKADIINNSLRENISSISPHSTLISTDYNEDDEKFEINAAFRTTKNLSSDNIRQMENFLELKLGKAVKLYADVVLIQKVDNKNSLNSFEQLLPKIKEKEVVEVEKTTTPEDLIGSVLQEKFIILPNAELLGYDFSYNSNLGTYKIIIKINAVDKIEENLIKSIKSVLEEKLKRRVEIIINVERSTKEKEQG